MSGRLEKACESLPSIPAGLDRQPEAVTRLICLPFPPESLPVPERAEPFPIPVRQFPVAPNGRTRLDPEELKLLASLLRLRQAEKEVRRPETENRKPV